MDVIINKLKDLVLDMIESSLIEIFELMYVGIGEVKDNMTITPTNWLDGEIWSFMEQIHENVTVLIGTMILTFILTVELYHLVIEKNQMKEIEIPTLCMYFIKMGIGVMVVAYAPKIVYGLFDLGNWAVERTVGIVSTTLSSPADLAAQVKEQLGAEEYTLGNCFDLWLSLFIAKLICYATKTIALVVVYGRLLQMVLYATFAPIPLATFMNKEWNVGQNYIKNIMALAFQGFLIILIFGVYTIVVATPPNIDPSWSILKMSTTILGHVGWGILLCMSLTKTHSVTQSIFGAH